MELPLDPVVIGILVVFAVGSILAIMAVTTCYVCNQCYRDGKHKCLIYFQPDHDDQQSVSATAANRIETAKSSVPTLKDSVLTGEGPPTYQMAVTEYYPRVYAGQYIGMSEVTDLSNTQDNQSDSRQPPDYQLVVPY